MTSIVAEAITESTIEAEMEEPERIETQGSPEGEVVLDVEGVSKKFCRSLRRSLFYGMKDITSEIMGARRENEALRTGEFWALQDISFQLRKGGSLGLVGANGAGKTTLLRMISGLIKPDSGSLTVRGRVAPLIALGAGFNPILTGRENIYANMAILGLSRQQIDERFDQVLAFAEITDALDSPVQTYSSGMAARLGFACAIHTEPDILLIDEVLAVGDVKFRGKCYRHLSMLREKGVSFIFVSHSIPAILSVCDSALYLKKGRQLMTGTPEEVTNIYIEDMSAPSAAEAAEASTSEVVSSEPVSSDSPLRIKSVAFKNGADTPLESLTSGEAVSLQIECEAQSEMKGININVVVREAEGDGNPVWLFNSAGDEQPFTVPQGTTLAQLQLPYCGLRSGFYIMKLSIAQGSRLHILDAVDSFRFKVNPRNDSVQGAYYQPRTWTIGAEPNAIKHSQPPVANGKEPIWMKDE
jgi:lipopolysaccharide transport system ATP-binding protein